jgi:hypothetical protein
MASINQLALPPERAALMAIDPIISAADATDFPAPPGTKVATNIGGPSKEIHPVLLWADYIYWPLSYIDNRVSMAIVVTDSGMNIIKVLEAHGARYIEEIRVNEATKEASFIGQAGQVATLSWHQLFIASTVSQPVVATRRVSINKAEPTATLAHMTVEEALRHYTSPSRSKYTDKDFDTIAKLLRHTKRLSKYSNSPRLYTLLCRLGCPNDLDFILDTGLSDRSLPLSQTQLPPDLSEEWKIQFEATQHLVCDDSNAVQMMCLGRHVTFSRKPDCFTRLNFLGQGARGEVDVVYCMGNAIARKRISRYSMSANDASAAAAFRNEVDNMKRISHRHCVRLVRKHTSHMPLAALMQIIQCRWQATQTPLCLPF